MEKRLECFKEFILENTGKYAYFYLSDEIVFHFFNCCISLEFKTPDLVIAGYYDLIESELATESYEFYNDERNLELIKVEIEDLYTKILQIGEEKFIVKLTKTAIEHLKLTGKCKIL